MPIPRIIHQTYKNHELPNIYKTCQHEILRLHPDFQYRFYTDEDIDAFIATEFPEYYKKFNELPRMIMKIDMFRYFLMYKYGGLYADMDYLMFRKFDLLDKRIVIPCNREDAYGTPSCLGNCIFASEPNHPYWKTLIDTLFTIDRNKINLDFQKDINVDGHVLGTGPMFVFGMWKKYLQSNGDIHVCKRELFHPITNQDNLYVQSLIEGGECYGMHICTGLWRNNLL